MLGGLVTVLFGHLIETTKIKAQALALYAGAAASLLFASIFGLVALRHWIAIRFDSQYPDLWIALGFVVIAAPLIGTGYYLSTRKPKTNPIADIALIAGPPALKLAARKTNAKVAAVGMVLVAGLFLGRRLMHRPPTEP